MLMVRNSEKWWILAQKGLASSFGHILTVCYFFTRDSFDIVSRWCDGDPNWSSNWCNVAAGDADGVMVWWCDEEVHARFVPWQILNRQIPKQAISHTRGSIFGAQNSGKCWKHLETPMKHQLCMVWFWFIVTFPRFMNFMVEVPYLRQFSHFAEPYAIHRCIDGWIWKSTCVVYCMCHHVLYFLLF